MKDINSLNKVILVGRLGQKPELRVLPQKDRSVARFSLATNERIYNPGTNQSTDRTEWHRIVVWGKLADFCEKYLTQGKMVLIEGKLRTRSWQDRDGNKRSSTEVEALNIIMLGKREGSGEPEAYSATPAATPVPPPAPASDFPAEPDSEFPPPPGEGDDEIPF